MRNLAELLNLSECSVLTNWPRSVEAGNSIVTSAPPLRLAGIFPDLSKVELTASLVRIKGPSDEPLHFHSLHLIGLVIKGHGLMETYKGRAYVKHGDVIIIPRGVYHYFTCDTGQEMSYIAYEISDAPIDYQKHWKRPM